MGKLSFLGGVILFAAVPAIAQEVPKAEVGGNYTYLRLDAGNIGTLDCHGGGGSATYNLTSYLGVAAEVAGCKVTGVPSVVSASAVSYLFGPRLTYRGYGRLEPFGEFLFGGVHTSASATGFPSVTDNTFAFALGGGADYKLSDRFAIRLVQADYLYTNFYRRNPSGIGTSTHQNNARIQAGIIFRFGGR